MSERRTEIMSQLSSLRGELSGGLHAQDIELSQAFDRLYLGYLRGEYSEDRVERAIGEIRSRLGQSHDVVALKPQSTTERDRVLMRNYEALADRLLSQDRGTWDMRHVEIVQGAVSHLASAQAPESVAIAHKLQERMSESVWAQGLEMAESVSELENDAQSVRQSLIDALQVANHVEPEVLSVDGESQVLAQERAVESAVSRAQVRSIDKPGASLYASLKMAKDYAEQSARRMHEAERKAAERDSAAVEAHVLEGIREAARRVIVAQSQKLADVYKKTLAAAKADIQASDFDVLARGIDKAVAAVDGNETAESVIERATATKAALMAMASRSQAAKAGANEIDKIVRQIGLLSEISREAGNAGLHGDLNEEVARAQYLDARMLFEQKRMQFEQSEHYAETPADMLKALDFAVETPVFETRDRRAFAKVLDDMQKIRQVAQSALSGDVGIYAPKAGSEYANNVGRALTVADKAAPNAAQMPTIQSMHAKRTNQILRDVRQLAYMPSVRGDMGFPVGKQAIGNSAQPLFKRIRFSQDNAEANEFLPSLYRVSGIKMRENKDKSPLRKSFGDLDLRGANYELVKIIENQFDPSVKGRQSDKVGGAGLDSAQRREPSDNPHTEALGAISDWMESHRDTRRYAADTTSLIKTGKMGKDHIESKLKGEAIQLPRSVQEKLTPFLGFDLSNIKIYAGPVSAMAAEAMGAHAFTLGHSIFLGKDKLNFSSAEGLGLLAHELLHTSHFNSGSSVDMKEQEAESLETRVKNAFGSGTNPTLALEKDTAKKTNGEIDQRSTLDGKPKAGTVGARYALDPEYIFDYVCDYVFDQIIEEMRMERERNGDD